MELLAKVLPILILFGAGYGIRKTNFLSQEAINGFKKIVIDIALPSVLFIAFVNLDFKTEYFGLILSIFLLCIIMMTLGFLLKKIPVMNHPILPFILSGFSFGLLGIPLYITVFGEANLLSIAVMGIGHEIFIWFVYVTVMKFVMGKEKLRLDTITGFLTSPLILAIIFGVGINLLGLSHLLTDNHLLNGVYLTLESMSKIATPLILIVIGYGLSFNKAYTKLTIIFVALRFVLILAVGYLFKFILIDHLIEFDQYMNYAYFTLLILPPPFSSSVLVGKYGGEEDEVKLVNNITVVYTCLSIVTYIVYMFFTQ